MAKIQKIEIVCSPCHKCTLLKERLETIIDCLEFKYNTRIKYRFIHTQMRKEIIIFLNSQGYTINQLPIALVNGQVAFIGHVAENVIRWKLEEIMRSE